jgi:hypothetical protein
MRTPGRLMKVRVDFQNADSNGRVRLNTAGTLEDVRRHDISLEDGLELRLVDAELEADGRVVFSDDENIWVAEVDWDEVIPA